MGGFAVDLKHSEDWDLWIRLARRAGNGVAVPAPLVGYRVWMSSSSRIDGLENDWHLIVGRYTDLTRAGNMGPDQGFGATGVSFNRRNVAGSTKPPGTRTLRCRWAPVVRPVDPTSPMVAPRFTLSPSATSVLLRW